MMKLSEILEWWVKFSNISERGKLDHTNMAETARKLEADNSWMRREIERVGHAIFTGANGYLGTEEDLQAIGQFVEGICETLERMSKLEAMVEDVRYMRMWATQPNALTNPIQILRAMERMCNNALAKLEDENEIQTEDQATLPNTR